MIMKANMAVQIGFFKSGGLNLWPHGQNGPQEILVGPEKFYDSRICVLKTKTLTKEGKKFLGEIVTFSRNVIVIKTNFRPRFLLISLKKGHHLKLLPGNALFLFQMQ